MLTYRLWLAFLPLWIASADAAQAHFLFIRLRPPAEAGRHAEVYFSDQADAGDPRFIDKIAHTKLWLQTKPGTFEPLMVHKTPDRLRALVPSSGSLSVIGECTYGVLGKKTPFLLRHYPKAVAGPADEIGALHPKAEIPFEIQLRGKGDELEFIALQRQTDSQRGVRLGRHRFEGPQVQRQCERRRKVETGDRGILRRLHQPDAQASGHAPG